MADELTPRDFGLIEICRLLATSNKIMAVKARRELTGEGLRDAKTFVDRVEEELGDGGYRLNQRANKRINELCEENSALAEERNVWQGKCYGLEERNRMLEMSLKDYQQENHEERENCARVAEVRDYLRAMVMEVLKKD